MQIPIKLNWNYRLGTLRKEPWFIRKAFCFIDINLKPIAPEKEERWDDKRDASDTCLAFVEPAVTFLDEFDLQRPRVGSRSVNDSETLVICIQLGSWTEDMPIAPSYPGNLILGTNLFKTRKILNTRFNSPNLHLLYRRPAPYTLKKRYRLTVQWDSVMLSASIWLLSRTPALPKFKAHLRFFR